MKYIFDGEYREFRGYVFFDRRPVMILDRGTLEAIKHQPHFKEVKDELQKVEATSKAEVLNPRACPNCGKVIKKWRTQHIKWCRK